MDLVKCLVESAGERLMHRRRLVPRHDERPPATALEERDELPLGYPGEHGRVSDLVAVQVQDREDCPVGPCV
jgi:hypothetical protein